MPREPLADRDVVSVHAGEEAAGAPPPPRARAPARSPHRPSRLEDAAIALRDARDPRWAAVRRAVVHGDHLQVDGALGEHALQRLLDFVVASACRYGSKTETSGATRRPWRRARAASTRTGADA